MYQGKHTVNPVNEDNLTVAKTKVKAPKKKLSKKSLTLVVSVLLIAIFAVGGTLAWLNTKTRGMTNTFTPGKVTTEVEENLDNDTKSDVKIKNTGNIDAYIRAMVVVTWKNEAGEVVYGSAPREGIDYNIEYDMTDWVLGSDGFYYYTKTVAPSDTTSVLIKSCSPVADRSPVDKYSADDPTNYYLSVEIVSSGIQSVPTSTVESSWGVTIAEDGTLSVN